MKPRYIKQIITAVQAAIAILFATKYGIECGVLVYLFSFMSIGAGIWWGVVDDPSEH